MLARANPRQVNEKAHKEGKVTSLLLPLHTNVSGTSPHLPSSDFSGELLPCGMLAVIIASNHQLLSNLPCNFITSVICAALMGSVQCESPSN